MEIRFYRFPNHHSNVHSVNKYMQHSHRPTQVQHVCEFRHMNYVAAPNTRPPLTNECGFYFRPRHREIWKKLLPLNYTHDTHSVGVLTRIERRADNLANVFISFGAVGGRDTICIHILNDNKFMRRSCGPAHAGMKINKDDKRSCGRWKILFGDCEQVQRSTNASNACSVAWSIDSGKLADSANSNRSA